MSDDRPSSPPADEPTQPDAVSQAEPIEDPADEYRRVMQEQSVDAERRIRRMTRRSFITAAAVGGIGYVGWRWARGAERIGGVPAPFRRVLHFNETLSRKYFSHRRLSPEMPRSAVASKPRVNGRIGLTPDPPAQWMLRVEAPGLAPLTLSLEDVRSLPRHDSITELKCIEGWSQVMAWGGARLSDLAARIGLAPERLPQYVALATPTGEYYVGLDMESAMHPQTLLAWELNGQPLTWQHGAPLRLAIPVKYGIKNIKRIGVIRFTDERPRDFWADRGYDWYAGM